MPKEYCYQCGGENVYQSSKPNFCCKCGKPFNRAAATNEYEEEEEYESEYIPSQSNLKGSVEANTSLFEKQNMGQLFQMSMPREQKQVRPAREQADGKDLLQKIQQECSSSRNNPIEYN